MLYSTLHCSYAILKIVYRSCPFFFMFVISSVVSYYNMFWIQFCKRLDSNRGTLEVISTAQQSFATKVSIVVILSLSTDCCSTGLTTTICVSIFFKNGPTPASFLFIFGLFKQTLLQFLQQICEKMSIQYTVPGFEPTTFRSWVSSHNH